MFDDAKLLADSCVVDVNNVARMNSYTLEPVGFIRSTVKGREDAPRQDLKVPRMRGSKLNRASLTRC